MSKVKPFYQQTPFYLSVIALALAIIALTLYALNCPSEFNGGVVSRVVITADIVGIISLFIAISAQISESYLTHKPVMMDIFTYKRFLIYIAFVALLYSFCMSILTEYSLIGTILYPIVSGTVGDPVDPVLSSSYFAKLLGTFVATILSLTVALTQKSRFYKTQNIKNQPLTETKAVGD